MLEALFHGLSVVLADHLPQRATCLKFDRAEEKAEFCHVELTRECLQSEV